VGSETVQVVSTVKEETKNPKGVKRRREGERERRKERDECRG